MFYFVDDEKFELSVVNPTLIMGPVLKGSTCTSIEVCLLFSHEGHFLEKSRRDDAKSWLQFSLRRDSSSSY